MAAASGACGSALVCMSTTGAGVEVGGTIVTGAGATSIAGPDVTAMGAPALCANDGEERAMTAAIAVIAGRTFLFWVITKGQRTAGHNGHEHSTKIASTKSGLQRNAQSRRISARCAGRKCYSMLITREVRNLAKAHRHSLRRTFRLPVAVATSSTAPTPHPMPAGTVSGRPWRTAPGRRPHPRQRANRP